MCLRFMTRGNPHKAYEIVANNPNSKDDIRWKKILLPGRCNHVANDAHVKNPEQAGAFLRHERLNWHPTIPNDNTCLPAYSAEKDSKPAQSKTNRYIADRRKGRERKKKTKRQKEAATSAPSPFVCVIR